MTYKKKLIEVALPLEAINTESALRKRKAPAGYPTMVHKWWAQRPLAACRAVLFASLIDDPSACPDEFKTEEAQDRERQRLFRIIERLILWENSTNADVLAEAYAEILKSTSGNPPSFLDPFCGGGSLPLEAQRLGLKSHGSDLNPVPVLITKSLIEIPPKFAGQPPVNPNARRFGADSGTWAGVAGLAEDIRYYGMRMRDEAQKRIGYLYPKAELPSEQGGGQAEVIAWIWARTVKCPNPACGIQMPLVRSFALSTKAGKQVRIEPRINEELLQVEYDICIGAGKPHLGTAGKQGAFCIRCQTPVGLDYVRSEGQAKRMSAQMMAVVAESRGRRIYLPATTEQVAVSKMATPEWEPDTELTGKAAVNVPLYGLTTHADLFTKRQLVALDILTALVTEIKGQIILDIRDTNVSEGEVKAYADAVATYLAFGVDRYADYGNSLATWRAKDNAMRSAFSKQALMMTWDFAEGSPFGSSSSGLLECVNAVTRCLQWVSPLKPGQVEQRDATAGNLSLAKPLEQVS